MALAIGMNSGSSFDGVDAVLIEVAVGADGQVAPPRFIGGISVPWPEAVRGQVLDAFANKLPVYDLTRLNYLLGAVYADAAKELMRQQALSPEDVTVIGYDGQTIYQEPPDRELIAALPADATTLDNWMKGGGYSFGLQLGEPGVVAVVTDVAVVTQFRPVDHALGGTGAPLMQYLDFVAFRDKAPIATVNIGGISNIQVVDADRARMRAFDCGPGVVMIDHLMRVLYDEPFDRDGEVAAGGTVSEAFLADLMSHPFFARKIPRSAWRLDFGAEYADTMLKKWNHLAPADLVATITQYTASAIVRSFRDNVPELDELTVLIASGGGVRNKTLFRLLQEQLPNRISLVPSDQYGVAGQFKEAVKFGVLAYAAVNLIGNNIPAASGARRFGILGKLVQPPRLARATRR